MNRKNLLIIAFALLLVALGNWLTEEGVKRVDKRLAVTPEQQQDYYLKDITITAHNEQGQLQHRLQAAQLSHFTGDGNTLLQKPRLDIYETNRLAWRVSAEQGELAQLQDEVILEGRVKMVQSSGTSPLQLSTSKLHLFPQKGVANTNRAVTLIQADNRIDAVGMRIERESKRLQLLSQVRGRYETLAP